MMLALDDFDDDEIVTLWCALYESGGAITTGVEAEAVLAIRDELGCQMVLRGITPADVEDTQDGIDMEEAIELLIRASPNIVDHR